METEANPVVLDDEDEAAVNRLPYWDRLPVRVSLLILARARRRVVGGQGEKES